MCHGINDETDLCNLLKSDHGKKWTFACCVSMATSAVNFNNILWSSWLRSLSDGGNKERVEVVQSKIFGIIIELEMGHLVIIMNTSSVGFPFAV